MESEKKKKNGSKDWRLLLVSLDFLLPRKHNHHYLQVHQNIENIPPYLRKNHIILTRSIALSIYLSVADLLSISLLIVIIHRMLSLHM
jgi:hypothetical protein